MTTVREKAAIKTALITIKVENKRQHELSLIQEVELLPQKN